MSPLPPSDADMNGPRLRLGVVGGGLIAQAVHLPTLQSLDGRFDVVALADPSRRVRERLCRRYAIAKAFADHRHLVEAEELDAVLVCSPNGTHAGVVADALESGLHAFVEKPLCIDPASAERIAALAEAGGKVVQVGYMKRFDPAFAALAAAPPPGLRHVRATTVDPGIGELLRPAGFVSGDDIPERLRRNAAEATAEQVARTIGSDDPWHVRCFSDAFLGALIHDVNAVLGILDAASLAGERAIDGFADGNGTLAGGTAIAGGDVRCSFVWALRPPAGTFTEELELIGGGSVCRLSFAAPYVRRAPAPLRVRGTGARQLDAYGDAYASQLEHFHDCVAHGVPCRTGPEQARRDIALLADMYRTVVARREATMVGALA